MTDRMETLEDIISEATYQIDIATDDIDAFEAEIADLQQQIETLKRLKAEQKIILDNAEKELTELELLEEETA